MPMSRQDADAVLIRALEEIRGLPVEHKRGHAPLAAIYRASTPVLRDWVYGERFEGRSLHGREELQRRNTEATIRIAQLTLAVSVIALIVSVIAAVTA
jgi:hypothetical protein